MRFPAQARKTHPGVSMPLTFRRISLRAVMLPAALAVMVAPLARAQQNSADNGKEELPPKERLAAETYVKPPEAIARLVTAPRQNNVTLSNQSPNRKYFLKLQSDGLPSVQAFGKPHYYFAGLQVDYKANRARVLTTRGSAGLAIIDASNGQSRTIETPKGATVSNPQWSPDGTKLAYIANFDDASRIYVADLATGKSRVVSPRPLLATLVSSVDWTADGSQLIAVLVPDGRKAEPKRPEIEPGPLVRLTDEKKEKTRNFASLLRDPFEKDLMEYYVTGQLAVINASNGSVRKIGQPNMISAVDASPDGKYFHVTLMRKPFSYIVQYNSFGTSEQIWDADGKMVTEIVNRPLREAVEDNDQPGPPGAAGQNDPNPRNVGWMPNGAGIYFLQQDPAPPRGAGAPADTGDAASQRGQGGARRKDRLYQWTPPFDASSKKVLLESDNRMGGVLFTDDAKTVFVAENANGTGHVYAVYFDEPAKKYTIWRVRGLNATVTANRGFGGGGGRGGTGADSLTFYQNPGTIMAKRGRNGGQVAMLSTDAKFAYLEGTRYFKTWQDSAPHGFVDKVEIKTGQKSRVFEGQPDMYETVTAALDDDFTKFVVSRESRTQVPDSYLRDAASGQFTKLTNNKDYTPEFTAAVRKRIPVTRADGHHFMVNLTLPPNYQAGTRLPAMFWFYPYEFTDQGGYDRTQRTNNINQFPNAGPRTIEYLITQGYAVANFDPPIIGENGRMNDNYVTDLVANLTAVIDELDKQGFIDRSRLGIGGHSYGAFSTVNAMVNTPFFKAGIAGDGMYNRSLTPNGFQNERRDFWEGQKTYLDMSPFFKADKLSGALLMYHSIEDQNVGTDPISSIRMMHALQGLGKTASLYMYPYEDHGPATKETLLDQWARWTAWLDIYVKNANKPKEAKVASE
jgi:dipeptidyl aminopeptidase/acylaminoacyl peptidase